MSLLTQKLRRKLEFDECDIHAQAITMGYDSYHPSEHKAFEYGAASEHARTSEIREALIDCVETLVAIREESAKAKVNGCVITEKCVRELSNEALARLERLCDE